MKDNFANNPYQIELIDDLLNLALKEDVRNADHTSIACIPDSVNQKAKLLIKSNGIISGIEVAKLVILKVDPELKMEQVLNDGDIVKKGDIAFYVIGNAISILKAERILLNIMQRMSGIATYTHFLVGVINQTKSKILDTRKTSPGMRVLEKMAVKHGGGENHRMGLYDMIMIKDNHIDFAGGIDAAIYKTKKYLLENNLNLKIEIEARNLSDVKSILLNGGIDRIMLDNFTPELLKEAINLINNKFETEASGGINEQNIVSYAATGVDFISVGALTHQVKSLDLSLKAC
jgi:nicotinate-nucleotide pyrophosphorylase (carboxylating)